jgi:alanine or glycine:cation symporter, AGCS family
MMLLALFGMTMKFHECTLAQMYRLKNPDGSISGGPMYYLKHGLAELGRKWGTAGKVLAVMFAIMCMGGAIGGGNMFQANQSFGAFASAFDIDRTNPWPARGFGIIMAGVVGMVIIGGIKRIGATTSRIVPFMCGIYVAAALVIIIADIHLLPHATYRIITEAFSPQAMFGGLIGVMMIGFQRAAFSNEAGLGSAAIAHAAAKTDEPVREGVVALLEPFIDTVIICFMTAIVVIITGAFEQAPQGADGAAITMHAFRSLPFIGDFFPYILTFCIILFAYSTMISWCYYGERAWGSLFGYSSVTIFRLVFIIFVFIGSVMSLSNVLDFCDLMILCMAFPNIIGGIILAPKVKRVVKDYWDRYRRGLMRPGPRGDVAEEGVVI